MTDDAPLSISEAFSKATSTFTSDSEESKEVNTAETEESTEELEDSTEEVGEIATKEEEPAEESEESALDHVDPNDIPEELQPVYKNLMKGFTQGRQRDAEARKEAEKRAEELENRIKELESKVPEQSVEKELPKFNSPQEYYAHLAREEAKKELQSEREKIEQEKIEAFEQQALDTFNSFDDRLKANEDGTPNPMRDFVGNRLDQQLAKYTEDNGSPVGFDTKKHLQEAVKSFEEYQQSFIKSYLEKQNKLSKTKASQMKKASPRTVSSKTRPDKPRSIQDAMKLAQERLNN